MLMSGGGGGKRVPKIMAGYLRQFQHEGCKVKPIVFAFNANSGHVG